MVKIKLDNNKMVNIPIPTNYAKYLEKSNQPDCRRAWVNWKIDVFNMSEKQAIIASLDPEWGYERMV